MDVTNSDEIYSVVGAVAPDAIVHFGTLSGPEHHPNHVVFESQANSTYYVCEAAAHFDVECVVVASSLATLGTSFQPEPPRVKRLPIDESNPLTAHNSYGLGKRAAETVADGVARRDGAPRIASLRFPWVVEPETASDAFAHPPRSIEMLAENDTLEAERNTMFAYLFVTDAATAVAACLETPLEGHEPFFVAGPDTRVTTPTADIAETVYPDADWDRDLTGRESLISNEKAARLLDWRPERSWTGNVEASF